MGLKWVKLPNRGLSESIVRIRINGIKPSSRTQDGFEHGSYENMVAGPHFSHAESLLKTPDISRLNHCEIFREWLKMFEAFQTLNCCLDGPPLVLGLSKMFVG